MPLPPMSALTDVAHVDGAAFHGRDDGRAVGELDEVDGQTLFLKVALVDRGLHRPEAAVVGHVGDVQGLGDGRSPDEHAGQRQQHSDEFLHVVTSRICRFY